MLSANKFTLFYFLFSFSLFLFGFRPRISARICYSVVILPPLSRYAIVCLQFNYYIIVKCIQFDWFDGFCVGNREFAFNILCYSIICIVFLPFCVIFGKLVFLVESG